MRHVPAHGGSTAGAWPGPLKDPLNIGERRKSHVLGFGFLL